MTFKEAILTSKPFKRTHWESWLEFNGDGYLEWKGCPTHELHFSIEDFCSNDWVIQEPKLEIIEQDVWDAFKRMGQPLRDQLIREFIRQLGFSDPTR